MLDETVLTRLDSLDQYVHDLRDIEPRNFDAYESDKMLRRYAERMVHMAIDMCIQIGISVLTRDGLRSPENYHDLFSVLGEHNILPRELVNRLTEMVEFRNLLVYEYDAVDDMLVYGFVKKRLGDFEKFSCTLRDYLRASNI